MSLSETIIILNNGVVWIVKIVKMLLNCKCSLFVEVLYGEYYSNVTVMVPCQPCSLPLLPFRKAMSKKNVYKFTLVTRLTGPGVRTDLSKNAYPH